MLHERRTQPIWLHCKNTIDPNDEASITAYHPHSIHDRDAIGPHWSNHCASKAANRRGKTCETRSRKSGGAEEAGPWRSRSYSWGCVVEEAPAAKKEAKRPFAKERERLGVRFVPGGISWGNIAGYKRFLFNRIVPHDYFDPNHIC